MPPKIDPQTTKAWPDTWQTTTPLAGGATYTSDWVNADQFALLSVRAKSDVAGATNGLVIETSFDGATVQDTISRTVSANTRVLFTLAVVSRWYRIKYTNGTSAQTTFSLNAALSGGTKDLTSSRGQIVTGNDGVSLVRTTNDLDIDICLGRIADHTFVRKFGANSSVSTSEEIIWNNSGTYQGFLTSATAVRVASGGDANDTAAGTGAREVTIVGLDENWEEATEAVATAGGSASGNTTTTFIRVFRAYVSSSGTYGNGLTGANAGNIVIEDSGGSNTLAQIGTGLGQTELAVYTVPASKTLLLRRVEVTVAGNKPATVKFFQRQNADDTSAPVQSRRIVQQFDELEGEDVAEYRYTESFAAKTDVWFTAAAVSGTSAADAVFYGVLIDD